MATVSSVVDLGLFAVFLGTTFELVMVGLVTWYFFHSFKLDAEKSASSDSAAEGSDAGAHA
jgi:hypothetical protein